MNKSRPQGIARALAELDEDHARARKQIGGLLAKIEKDPIDALNIRFTPNDGFVADSLTFEGMILSGSIYLLNSRSISEGAAWSPQSHQAGPTTVKPVGFALSPWGVLTAFEIAHEREGWRLKLQGLNITRPGSGPIYLVDPVNSAYLRLIASSLQGEVLYGIPRTGVLVFELPSAPTDRLQIQFSEVSLSPVASSGVSFSFEYTSAELAGALQQVLDGPSPAEHADQLLDEQVAGVRSDFLKQQAGCAAAIVSMFGAFPHLQRALWP
jgi:hypothetical protein